MTIRTGNDSTMQPQSGLRHIATIAVAVIALIGAASLLGGCNTTAGVGKDVSATGNAVTNAADKAEQGL
jgi:predicted small secreted protein